jgi:hypothetical protein
MKYSRVRAEPEVGVPNAAPRHPYTPFTTPPHHLLHVVCRQLNGNANAVIGYHNLLGEEAPRHNLL